MIYVYDILCNLNEVLYDFYDWNDEDSFTHLRRVPLIKVSSDNLYDMITKKIKVNEDVLLMIKDKTQVFSSRNLEVIDYAAIFTDGKVALMIEFDSKGYSIRKSKFLVNEEMEVLELSNNMKVSLIQYNVVRSRVLRNKMIRSEKKILDNILEELVKFKDDKERLDYLYFEWFDKSEGAHKYEELIKDLKSGFSEKHLEFLELLNLFLVKK